MAARALGRAFSPAIGGRVVEAMLGAASMVVGSELGQGSAALGLAAGGVVAIGSALVGDAMSTVGPAPTSDPAIVPTIYSPNDLVGEIESVADFLQSLNPPALMLHSTMENLTQYGASITARVQGLLPGVEVWWGVTDDEHYSDVVAGRQNAAGMLALRTNVGLAAAASGIPWLIWDAEPAWTHGTDGFDSSAAQAALAAVAAIPGAPRQGLTTYPQPTAHGDFPWQGWLEAQAFLPNVYWGPGINDPSGSGPSAYAGASTSISRAFQLGLLAPDERIIAYLLMHGTLVGELGWVADHYAQVACWTLTGSDTMDANGKAFMQAMVALDRKGPNFRGVGRIARFQASQGLEQNSKLDGDTLDALGVPRP